MIREPGMCDGEKVRFGAWIVPYEVLPHKRPSLAIITSVEPLSTEWQEVFALVAGVK